MTRPAAAALMLVVGPSTGLVALEALNAAVGHGPPHISDAGETVIGAAWPLFELLFTGTVNAFAIVPIVVSTHRLLRRPLLTSVLAAMLLAVITAIGFCLERGFMNEVLLWSVFFSIP